jgi:hypothetical protein
MKPVCFGVCMLIFLTLSILSGGKKTPPLKVEHFRKLITIGSSSIFYHQNIETDPVSKTLWNFQPETVDIDHNIYHVQSILS